MADSRAFWIELQRRNVLRAAVLYIGAVWALAQGSAQLSPVFGVPDWITRWFVAAAAIGFPFWLAFAWFYGLTPGGPVREDDVAADASIRRRAGRRLDVAIIGVLAVAVVLLLTHQLGLHQPPAEEVAPISDKSIAVLPLANAGGDQNARYFADGLSEELIGDLTRIASLKVVGKTSSFRFRDTREDSRTIGEKLGVAHLLEGTVRQQGDRVRIVVGMIRAADGRSLWSQTYDREFKDIFAVQGDIAQAVAASLQVTLGDESLGRGNRPASGNVQAYEAYVLAGSHALTWTEAGLRKAIGYYHEAIRIDPGYAAAYAGLAFAHLNLGNQLKRAEREPVHAEARKALATARALAPDLPAVVRAHAYAMGNLDADFAGALAESRRLLALSPDDPSSLRMLSAQLMNSGQLDEAVATLRKAISLDPLSSGEYGNLLQCLMALGHLDEAERVLRRLAERSPEPGRGEVGLALLELLRGNAGPAQRFAETRKDPEERLWFEALAWHTQGATTKADAAMREFTRRNADDYPYSIAQIHAWRQQPDEMFAWLDRAAAQGEPAATDVLFDFFMRPYWHDPRFAAYCRKVGLPPPQPVAADEAAGVPASGATAG